MATAGSIGEPLLTFAVSGRNFALPTAIVREVARLPRLARVPHAPAALLGLANMRGAIVPVLSVARLLHRLEETSKRVIIVDLGELVGLAVDNVTRTQDGDQARLAEKIDVTAVIASAIPPRAERRPRASTAEKVDAPMTAAEAVPLVAFATGNQDFALPLAAVVEVLRLPIDIARMPHADAAVVGSMPLRGRVLPLLSLSALLGLPSAGTSDKHRALVVRIGGQRVGLVADALRAILRVPETDIDPVPLVLSRGDIGTRIQAICRLDEGRRLISVLAIDQLLPADLTERLSQGEVKEHDDMADNHAANTSEQLLLFRIGDEEFALPIAAVEEVTPVPAKLTRLPKAPAFVQGVMNLRGQVIPVIDQVQRFSGAAATGKKRRVIVMRFGEVQAGFIVDAVSAVLRVEAAAVTPAPDLGGDGTQVFERVLNLPDAQKIVLIVSPRELLDRAEQDVLEAINESRTNIAP